MQRKFFDVGIVGAGVLGCSTALACARKGLSVVVLDKNKGAGGGSTSYSSGILRSLYTLEESIKLSWEGYERFFNWEDFLKIKLDPEETPKIRRTGALILRNPRSASFVEKVTAGMSKIGHEFEELSLNDLEQRLGKQLEMNLDVYVPRDISDPLFATPEGDPDQPQKVAGAVYFPQAGYVSDPQLVCKNFHRAAVENNAFFLMQHNVTQIIKEGKTFQLRGKNVSNAAKGEEFELEVKNVINCAGPFSSKVNDMVFDGPDKLSLANLGLENLKTKPMRQEVAFIPVDKKVMDLEKNSFPIFPDLDLGFYARPEVGNKLLVGCVEAACDELEYLDSTQDPEGDLDTNLSEKWMNYVYRAAVRFPWVRIPNSRNTQGIVSTYDMTPDWVPIYDKTDLDGFFVAIGTSGNQFKTSPVVGELMADLILHSEDKDHDKNPTKLKLSYISKKVNDPSQAEISTAAFSRKRNPNTYMIGVFS